MTKGRNDSNNGKNRSKRTGFILVGVLILLGSVVLGSLWWAYDLWQDMYVSVSPAEDNVIQEVENDKERETLPDVLTVLLLGLDSRDRTSRADAIMVLSLHKSGEMSIVSIPRDMRVEIPGRGMDKINHAHAFGGVSLALETVEDFLDVTVDHYVTTDFEGFENVIDILDGVEIDVEKRMYYKGIDVTIDLQPGLQVLDGDKALQYVRFRSDSEGDFGRVRRQQQLVKAVTSKAFKPASLLKIPRVLPEVSKNVRTDLELNQALSLARKLKNLDLEEINTVTLPGNSSYVNDISYVIPEDDEIEAIVERYINFSHSHNKIEQEPASA